MKEETKKKSSAKSWKRRGVAIDRGDVKPLIWGKKSGIKPDNKKEQKNENEHGGRRM